LQDNPKINESDIPDEVYQTGCRVLASSIRLLFEKPGTREDYENWKAKRYQGKESITDVKVQTEKRLNCV